MRLWCRRCCRWRGLVRGACEAWAASGCEVEAELARVQAEIDELCFELYGISEEDRRAITEGFGVTDGDGDER